MHLALSEQSHVENYGSLGGPRTTLDGSKHPTAKYFIVQEKSRKKTKQPDWGTGAPNALNRHQPAADIR